LTPTNSRPPEPLPAQVLIPGADAPSLFLMPGAVSFVRRAARLRTLLGSCVAVVVWQPRVRWGGMCHYLLSERAGVPGPAAEEDGRFATDALAMLEHQMRETGLAPSQYQAHIVGGSNCFPEGRVDLGRIGERNAQWAKDWCASLQLPVITQDTGGRFTRRVEFDLATGVLRVEHTDLRVDPYAAQRPGQDLS